MCKKVIVNKDFTSECNYRCPFLENDLYNYTCSKYNNEPVGNEQFLIRLETCIIENGYTVEDYDNEEII